MQSKVYMTSSIRRLPSSMGGSGDDDSDVSEYEIEVPSCIESLISTTGQLRELAQQATYYYGKILLCYGCVSEPPSLFTQTDSAATSSQERTCCKSRAPVQASDRQAPGSGNQHRQRDSPVDLKRILIDKRKLESIDSLVSILPCLNELCSFVERCLATIEATIKRITYYLNLATQRDKVALTVRNNTFILTPHARLDAIFVSLMDLMFALIGLDKTLCDRTTIQKDLGLLDAICRTLASNPDSDILAQGNLGDILDTENLTRLNEYLGNIKLTLSLDGLSIFDQCIAHFQHLGLILSKDETQPGFKYFAQLFEEFLLFYADHLVDITGQNRETDSARNNIKVAKTVAIILINTNVIPTLSMNNHPRKILGLVSLSALYLSIFKKVDKRLIKAINQAIQRTKCSNLVLFEGSHCHVLLDEFIQSYLPKASLDKKSIEYLGERMNQLTRLDTNLEFERLSRKSLCWLSKLKAEAVDQAFNQASEWPRKQILLLDQGLKLFEEINSLIGHVSAACEHQNIAISKTNLIGLYRLMALVKFIRTGLEENLDAFLTGTLLKLEHSIRVQWDNLFNEMQKRQIMMDWTDRKLELIWSMKFASMISEGELMSDPLGRITQSLCLPVLMAALDQTELNQLNLMMDLLRLDLRERLESLSDCSVLYCHLTSLSTYYTHSFEELQGATRELNALHLALDDVPNLFEITEEPSWSQVDMSWLTTKRDLYLNDTLSKEVMEQFKVDYLDRVCQELEVELRLQVHKDLYTDEHVNPLRRHTYDFKEILQSPDDLPVTFKLLKHRINLKHYVEHHLNAVYYNLTAIAPNDWLTYDNMMNFARHKYGLKFVETQLPAQTLDSGLDLVDIIRNLALFASRYSYDLTNQSFLEKCPNRLSTGSTIQSTSLSYAPSASNQTLNVLQIEHVAQSIQTHGYGILDSAVNCTYQTLKKLINVFARQLSDDKLRPVLQKEYQHMVAEFKAKQASHWVISFDKASSIARKFKLSASSLTESMSLHSSGQQQQYQRPGIDLDSIRQTVTQLGNLMAFIRLIKSGALNSASRAVEHVPELDDLTSLRLSECAQEEYHDYMAFPVLLEATKNLDECLSDLGENFLPKTNYSKIIVSLFTRLLTPPANTQSVVPSSEEAGGTEPAELETRPKPESEPNKQLEHLKLFFLLVPALTINYIEYLINCKERVLSRSSVARFGALLSDDGFPLGVAFLLTILGQTGDFNKLNWLAQTSSKLETDIEQVESLLRDPKYEDSLRQTSSITLRRLKRLHSEYVALDNTLSCALPLFEDEGGL